VTGYATVAVAAATVVVSGRENSGSTTVVVEGWINLTRVATLHTETLGKSGRSGNAPAHVPRETCLL